MQTKPSDTDAAPVVHLSVTEREVLHLLGTGCSLQSVGRRLVLSSTTVKAHVRELQRKLRVPTTEALRGRAAALCETLDPHEPEPEQARPLHLPHQSRWLPDVVLSPNGPLGCACRQTFNCRSLRDVADYVRDCPENPGPVPDDPHSLLILHAGTLGAKHALLAALAAECGRDDVQLVIACYALEVARGSGSPGWQVTLPLAVCHLRWRSRDVQIAEPGAGSLLFERAVSVVRVNPVGLAAARVQIYKRWAIDWCRALDLNPVAFARLRSAQLQQAERLAVFEDLLGHSLSANYEPILQSG